MEQQNKWINPTDLLIKNNQAKLKTLNKHISKVISALIQMGHYDFKIEFNDDFIVGDKVAKISNLPFGSPYNNICVWDDGHLQYCTLLGSVQFEGCTKKINYIKQDIMGK